MQGITNAAVDVPQQRVGLPVEGLSRETARLMRYHRTGAAVRQARIDGTAWEKNGGVWLRIGRDILRAQAFEIF